MFSTNRPIALSCAGLTAVLALGACGVGADGSQSMGGINGHGTSSDASTPSGSASRAADVMFAQMMIPHHEQAIEMAELALQNPSASAGVRSLAEQIKDAQGPEIETMSRWLRSWGVPASAPMGGHAAGGMMSAEDMQSLVAAQGSGFDRIWLSMMIEHHQGATTMAQDVLSTTADAEVKTLARAVVEGQKKEITTMQGLLG